MASESSRQRIGDALPEFYQGEIPSQLSHVGSDLLAPVQFGFIRDRLLDLFQQFPANRGINAPGLGVDMVGQSVLLTCKVVLNLRDGQIHGAEFVGVVAVGEIVLGLPLGFRHLQFRINLSSDSEKEVESIGVKEKSIIVAFLEMLASHLIKPGRKGIQLGLKGSELGGLVLLQANKLFRKRGDFLGVALGLIVAAAEHNGSSQCEGDKYCFHLSEIFCVGVRNGYNPGQQPNVS